MVGKRINPLSRRPRSRRLVLAVRGAAGTGKSVFAATLADAGLGRLCYFDVERKARLRDERRRVRLGQTDRQQQSLSGSRILASAVCCCGEGEKGDCQWGERQRARRGLFACDARNIIIGCQLQTLAVETHSTVTQVSGIKRITVRSTGDHQRA